MPRSLNGPYYYIAVVLWLAWAFLLGGGLIGHVAEDAGLSSIETELKAGSSLALVAFGWLSVTVTPPAMRRVPVLIAVGMTLGCLGDASPLLGSRWPDPQRTLGNMLLFGLGHVAYIRACVLVRRWERAKCGATLWYGSLAVWLVIGGVLWYFAAHIGTRYPVMRVPALGYTLLLSATAGATVGYALAQIQGQKVFVLRFIQARNPEWVQRSFFAEYNPRATWLDQLRPAFGKEKFFFEEE